MSAWPRGSEWRRWDLHLHSPGTKLASGFGEAKEETWKKYLTILEKSEVQVFGITDYFSCDNYFLLLEYNKKFFPDGEKVFFPNIEFRLTETISSDGKNVHTHVLFDNDPRICSKEDIRNFFNDLRTHSTNEGVRVRCADLKNELDFRTATVRIDELVNSLKGIFSDRDAYLIITAASNDGLRGVDTESERSKSISDELDKASHAFFGNSRNTSHFLREDRYETHLESKPKPVFSGSDAHSFEDLDRLSGDEPNFEPTWIKANPTFRGLRQTLFEPKGRVFIGEQPSVLIRQSREATRFIDRLEVKPIISYSGEKGLWFENVLIPFNPELTAIIGNKGSGKSAIADIIALLADSRMEEHFSFLIDDPNNKKFKQRGYAENFEGRLVWKSGAEKEKNLDESVDRSKPEAVKYLPQNYFERLTNEIEVKAFRREIEEVVFSHVEGEERMGTSSFQELEEIKTSQSRNDISELKARLREINIDIVDLEGKADPEFRKRIEGQLKAKQEEWRVLEASKPKEVPKPELETEEQKIASGEISKLSHLLYELRNKEIGTIEKLGNLKSDRQKLDSIKESIIGAGSKINQEKENLRETCTKLGLDIDEIFSYNINFKSIDEKIEGIKKEVSKLEDDSDLEKNAGLEPQSVISLKQIRQAMEIVSFKIQQLKETLSAPHKRYQNYLQAIKEITSKQEELQGNKEFPKAGTIYYLEGQIEHIDKELSELIKQRCLEREALSKSIFHCKNHVREFYEGLKNSVEALLKTISSDEFSVTIDASFVPQHSFKEEFFYHVNQNVRGFFKGIEDGGSRFQKMKAEVDWNDVESVLGFINSLVNKIKEEPVQLQIKDLKKFYDFLFSFEFFEPRYELRLGGKNLNQLSPGEKGLLLLVFYLHLDKEKTPLIIDQPEDNLDNDSIFSVLAKCIREAKKTRQVILVTHNPNLAIGADAEQIIYVTLKKHKNYKFTYENGSIEEPKINNAVVKVLEGTTPAFVRRRLAYQIR